jgi:hypothetical protein
MREAIAKWEACLSSLLEKSKLAKRLEAA